MREFSEFAVRGLADMPESKTTRLNVELLESGLYRVISTLGELWDAEPEKALSLLLSAARVQSLLAGAVKNDAEKIIKATDFSGKTAEKRRAKKDAAAANAGPVRVMEQLREELRREGE